jgi:hypothetical protein
VGEIGKPCVEVRGKCKFAYAQAYFMPWECLCVKDVEP